MLSYRDRRFDARMRIVILEREVAETEIEDRFHFGIQLHRWQRSRIAASPARCPSAGPMCSSAFASTSSLLRGLPYYIEEHAEKHVGAALVHLAGDAAIRDVK